MQILVTGGAGYIGSIVTSELIDAGHPVVVVDNLQFGHREAVRPEADFIRGDLADAQLVRRVFDQYRIDAIMHFASNTLPGESMEEPFKYIGDNVVNAVYLLRAATDHGVKRFVLSSTANLFDKPEQMPIAEDEAIIPGSPYGESKYMIERMLYWADRVYGMKYACLRYFNAAGAHPSGELGEDHTPEFHLIPRLMKVALGQQENIVVFGNDYPTLDGTCMRDYIHVVDLAQAHILAMEVIGEGPSRVYNLGSGSGYSVLQVIEMVERITGREIAWTFGPRRPGDPAKLIADSSKIKQELCWKPKFSDLQTIVETAWRWHRLHPYGYSS